MKPFPVVLLAAALLLLLSGTAGASTLYYTGLCGEFFAGVTSNTLSGTWECPTAAALGVAAPVSAEFLVYDTDYSSGLAASVTTVTNWTFGGAGFAFPTDTTTVTGASSSGLAVSSDGLTLNPF